MKYNGLLDIDGFINYYVIALNTTC